MGLEIGINGVNKAITKVEFGVNSAWKEVNKSEIGINNAWKEGYVNIPGPSILIAGDTNAGYYGKAIGIITINDLISKTGVVEGTAQVSGDITWLKFAYQGKTLFVADRVLKCSLSWDDINAHDCVFGKIISLQKSYKCRLICGTEWNNLIVKFTPNNEDSHSSDHIFHGFKTHITRFRMNVIVMVE